VNGCTQPAQWRNPFPFDIYLEQQWTEFIQGLLSNVTRAQQISVNDNNFQTILVQALSEIANEVLEAIASFDGCICVYPNDNKTYHQAMINNNVSYIYAQNYNRPYLLNASIVVYGNASAGPLFTNDVLQSIPGSPNQVLLEPGTILQVTLGNPNYTILSAVRAFGLGNGKLATLYTMQYVPRSACFFLLPYRTFHDQYQYTCDILVLRMFHTLSLLTMRILYSCLYMDNTYWYLPPCNKEMASQFATFEFENETVQLHG